MRLFELVIQNVSPRKIAAEVITSINNARGGNIVSVTALNLLHSVMDAIGFNYYVSMNEITTLNFQWLDVEAMSYRFTYNYKTFGRFQQSLEEICKAMYQNKLHEELIAIVNIFLCFCQSINEQWEDRFWEPFSLINYSFLISIHKIRKDVSEPNPRLNTICHELFENAQKGLGHSDSHQIILKGLCVLLGRDYSYFSSYDRNIFKFYTNCMEYEFCRTSGDLFVYMQSALENTNVPDDGEKNNLVSYLTDPDMIKAYCAFALQNSRNQQFCLLKFLNSLLSHLPLLECFSREQVHIIFSNALKESKKTRDQAISFYLNFMHKNKFTNKLIFRDILEFLTIKANGTEPLDRFIDSIWDEFSYIKDLDAYLKVLQKSDWDMKILCVTAQVTWRIYKNLYEECENNEQYSTILSKFLLKLPSLLMLLKEKWQIRGILLNIYSETDFEKAKFTIKEFPIAADRYIKYALRYLKKNGEDYSIVQNTVYIMLQMMSFFNMDEELDEFANDVYSKYKGLIDNLDQLTETQIMSFQNILVMLSNIASITFALYEQNLFELLISLEPHLLETNKFQELSTTFDCFIDSFGVTIYSAGCIRIFSLIKTQMTPEEATTEYNVLLNKVYSLLKYILERLENSYQSNTSIIFIEAAIRAFCKLYIKFNFKLERHVYHILVNSVNHHVFEEPNSVEQHRQKDMQKSILQSFNSLHRYVDIPVAITWKIVINFGMSGKFEKELIELMDILLEYDSEKFKKPSLYAYIVPVAIFNLFQRQLPLHKFQKALKAHKNYVEEKIKDGSERLMKIHIVLTLVNMIEKSIKAGKFKNQHNRLELLTNMNILLTEVYQKESDIILTQARRLEEHDLTPREQQTLTSFQEQLIT